MIFKIHYGLWYGALVGIIPFMFNYAVEYAGASATQHGILYTILPFVALIAKPVICSIADKYAAHHHCLLFFITTTIIGYGSLAIYPFFPEIIAHKTLIWVLFCIGALVGNTSMCIVNSIGDSMAVNSCQRNNVTYGSYRLWGPVGFGIFGAIWGIANQALSMPKYTPGILTMVTILVVNILLLAFWYDRAEFQVVDFSGPPTITATPATSTTSQDIAETRPLRSQKPPESGDTVGANTGVAGGDDNNIGINRDTQQDSHQGDHPSKLSRFQLLVCLSREHISIFGYLFIFTFCGAMTGIHWQFFFRYLEQMSQQDNQSFTLITTLALPVQALGGELLFFMLASSILRRLGASLTLVICLMSFASRYLLYAYLIPNVSVYWVLLVELLQGPAFGLMYCVLTHQANYYSDKIDAIVEKHSDPSDLTLKNSLHATLQGVLGAAFEGLGLGLGAIVGGRSYDVTPILMWKIAGFSALAVASLSLICTLASRIARNLSRPPTVTA